MKDLKEIAEQKWRDIMSNREKIMEGFIAEFGCKPSEIEQVIYIMPNGEIMHVCKKRDDRALHQAIAQYGKIAAEFQLGTPDKTLN